MNHSIDWNWLIVKIEGALRLFMVRNLSERLPLYIVNEYPKSGGSWVAQMLASYLNVPFPRNRFPSITKSVCQGHYSYTPSMKNVFIVIRDGRDVMISYYYYSFFTQRYNKRFVELNRKTLHFDDYNDIVKNLPKFIEYRFTKKQHPSFTWAEFINDWIERDVAVIRYENLLINAAEEMGKALRKVLSVEPDTKKLSEIAVEYSFRNLARRKQGIENKHSFLRKGVAGDWKNNFSKEAKQLFCEFAGQELIRLGYEVDNSWVAKDIP